jgi:hypothetical protein
VPSGGQIPARGNRANVEIGIGFVGEIEPLPPAAPGTASMPRSVRLIEATFKLLESRQLRVDTGSGFVDVPFRGLGDAFALDRAPPPFSGDKRIRALGWKRASIDPLWRIELPAPLPFTLLSATQEMKVNDR